MGAAGIVGGAGAVMGLVGGVISFIQANAQAKAVKRQGRYAYKQRQKQGRHIIARQRAQFAAAGVVENIGTPLDVVSFSAANEEYEALSVKHQFDEQARQIKQQAANQLLSSVTQSASSGAGIATQGLLSSKLQKLGSTGAGSFG